MRQFSYFLWLFFLPVFAFGQSLVLTVEIDGFQSNQGQVIVHLYNQADAFPTKPERAVAKRINNISNRKSTMQFTQLPAGTYAVAAHHDENANGKLDTNWLGIPKEGLGSSNDAKGQFGPPTFTDAKLNVSSNETIRIRIRC